MCFLLRYIFSPSLCSGAGGGIVPLQSGGGVIGSYMVGEYGTDIPNNHLHQVDPYIR